MPIKPENLARYPDDWNDISRGIRFLRAEGRCECEGECGHDHGGRCGARYLAAHQVTGSKVILTVAHLDHTPENCAPENLKAMCQRCHLGYDHDHHQQTRYATKREGKAASDLFEETEK